MAASIRIGISGWRHEPWRGVFYPQGLAQRRELEYASRMFPTIDLNGSFYSLQRPEYFAQWHRETPDDFVFAVKGSRYITHLRRLKAIEAPLANFFASGVLELHAKLGPILRQFAPQMPFIAEHFDAFFARLPRDTQAARRLRLLRQRRQGPRAVRRGRAVAPARSGESAAAARGGAHAARRNRGAPSHAGARAATARVKGCAQRRRASIAW